MTRNNLKRIFCLFLIGILCLSLFGCKKKGSKKEEEIVEEVVTYTQEEMDEKDSMITALQNELAIYDDSYKTLKAFRKKNVIQAGVWTYNKIKDKVVLNKSDSESSLTPVGYSSSINLGDKISVKADSWLVNTNTSEIEVCIPQHSYGKIKIYNYDDDDFIAADVGYDIINPYLEDNRITSLSQRNMYINNIHIGQEVTGAISIIDTTTNGMEINVPASQLFEYEQLRDWGLDEDSDITAVLKLDDGKELNAKYKVGVGNAGGTLIWYEFLMLDESGVVNTNDLINNININNSPLYLR